MILNTVAESSTDVAGGRKVDGKYQVRGMYGYNGHPGGMGASSFPVGRRHPRHPSLSTASSNSSLYTQAVVQLLYVVILGQINREVSCSCAGRAGGGTTR